MKIRSLLKDNELISSYSVFYQYLLDFVHSIKIITMALSTCLTKWACFNDVFKDWPLQNLFGQWVCFNGIQFLTPSPSSIHLVSTEHLHCWKYELWPESAVSCEHWGHRWWRIWELQETHTEISLTESDKAEPIAQAMQASLWKKEK